MTCPTCDSSSQVTFSHCSQVVSSTQKIASAILHVLMHWTTAVKGAVPDGNCCELFRMLVNIASQVNRVLTISFDLSVARSSNCRYAIEECLLKQTRHFPTLSSLSRISPMRQQFPPSKFYTVDLRRALPPIEFASAVYILNRGMNHYFFNLS